MQPLALRNPSLLHANVMFVFFKELKHENIVGLLDFQVG